MKNRIRPIVRFCKSIIYIYIYIDVHDESNFTFARDCGGPPSLADDIVVVVDRSNITVCPNEGRNRRGASLCARRLKSRLQESTR